MLPREKLIQMGASALTIPELLAIVLGTGIKGQNVFDLSQTIASHPTFRKTFTDQQVEYWTKIVGIGTSKAARLVAGSELAKRMLFEGSAKTTIATSKDVFECFRSRVVGKTTESFYVLCLDQKNNVILCKELHEGFAQFVITDMKVLFSTVLLSGAISFICVHNHPSGDVEPSEEDRELTRKIAAGANSLDLRFLDHVIVSLNRHYGLFENEPELFC